jgi:hypothetical protein
LIEVITQGIGAVSRPYLVKRNANAKAHVIAAVAKALDQALEQVLTS